MPFTTHQHTGALVSAWVVDADLEQVGVFEDRSWFVPPSLGVVGVCSVKSRDAFDLVSNLPTVGSVREAASLVLKDGRIGCEACSDVQRVYYAGSGPDVGIRALRYIDRAIEREYAAGYRD